MKRILFVDDDPGLQEALKFIFDTQKYAVTVLANGYFILNNEYAVPDLYILDKQLSGIDGLDICRFLKQQESTRHVPVIMLSASPKIHQMAQSAGADASLEKPFAIGELRNLVDLYLNEFKK